MEHEHIKPQPIGTGEEADELSLFEAGPERSYHGDIGRFRNPNPLGWPVLRRATVVGIVLAVAGCAQVRDPTSHGPSPTDGTSTVAPSAAGASPSPPATGDAVDWLIETDPVPNDRDAADDPAIWLDPDDLADSLIVGTNKKGEHGLLVYDLAGRQVSSHDGGPMNNVDLRANVALDGRSTVLVVASAIDARGFVLFELDPDSGVLEPLSNGTVDTGIRGGGLCLWQPDETSVFAFTTAGNGIVQQWVLVDDGQLDPALVREIELESRAEGCVADDAQGDLFLAEEAVGVWHVLAAPETDARPELIDEVGGSGELVADVEGMAIATYEDGRRYLVVSSQGDDRFVVYRLEPDGGAEPIGEFRVRDPEAIDDVSHTDGLEVVVGDLADGPFSRGLLVVQDDDNEQRGGGEAHQNFKLVPWDAIETSLGLE